MDNSGCSSLVILANFVFFFCCRATHHNSIHKQNQFDLRDCRARVVHPEPFSVCVHVCICEHMCVSVRVSLWLRFEGPTSSIGRGVSRSVGGRSLNGLVRHDSGCKLLLSLLETGSSGTIQCMHLERAEVEMSWNQVEWNINDPQGCRPAPWFTSWLFTTRTFKWKTWSRQRQVVLPV